MSYTLNVADNVRYCCGVGEVYGITRMDNNFIPKEVVLSICAVDIYRHKKAVYLFEDVNAPDGKYPLNPDSYGFRVQQLAKFITENKLGTAIVHPPTINPNTLNVLTLLTWIVDREALRAFWRANEPRAVESEWIMTPMGETRTIMVVSNYQGRTR